MSSEALVAAFTLLAFGIIISGVALGSAIGDGNVASVRGAEPRELLSIIAQLARAVEGASLPLPARDEARALVAELEKEARAPAPVLARVKAYLTQLGTYANESAELSAAWTPLIVSILGLFGVR